jgi:4-diphosphocytidyl-2-C-methyl-D-erythritol kinase
MLKIKSFAKINLGLEVLGKRADGYHDLRTLYQSVNLFDQLTFKPGGGEGIVLGGSDSRIPWDERNLIFRAAAELKKRFGIARGIEIWVDKNIPSGQGLGGGSSNAAVTLYALNRLWELDVGKNELAKTGKALGADVPYFLEGGLCLGTGRGDELVLLEDMIPRSCLLYLPDISLLTARVYGQLPPLTSEDKESRINKFLNNLEFRILENGLEETVFGIHPQLRDIKCLFYELGSELSLVSGSGAAVFGLFQDKEKALGIYERLKNKYPLCLVETLSRARYWDSIEVGV